MPEKLYKRIDSLTDNQLEKMFEDRINGLSYDNL